MHPEWVGELNEDECSAMVMISCSHMTGVIDMLMTWRQRARHKLIMMRATLHIFAWGMVFKIFHCCAFANIYTNHDNMPVMNTHARRGETMFNLVREYPHTCATHDASARRWRGVAARRSVGHKIRKKKDQKYVYFEIMRAHHLSALLVLRVFCVFFFCFVDMIFGG